MLDRDAASTAAFSVVLHTMFSTKWGAATLVYIGVCTLLDGLSPTCRCERR